LVSTTTYASLFAAVGYAWGGAGASFGLPYFAAGYAAVQGTIATLSHGAILSHQHTENYYAGGGGANVAGITAVASSIINNTPSGNSTALAGGTDNLAAGMGTQFIVKY
jgi:hypothetical protein